MIKTFKYAVIGALGLSLSSCVVVNSVGQAAYDTKAEEGCTGPTTGQNSDCFSLEYYDEAIVNSLVNLKAEPAPVSE